MFLYCYCLFQTQLKERTKQKQNKTNPHFFYVLKIVSFWTKQLSEIAPPTVYLCILTSSCHKEKS